MNEDPRRALIANAINCELLRQDDNFPDDREPPVLGDDLIIDYIDQGRTDLGLIADAILAQLDYKVEKRPIVVADCQGFTVA